MSNESVQRLDPKHQFLAREIEQLRADLDRLKDTVDRLAEKSKLAALGVK